MSGLYCKSIHIFSEGNFYRQKNTKKNQEVVVVEKNPAYLITVADY